MVSFFNKKNLVFCAVLNIFFSTACSSRKNNETPLEENNNSKSISFDVQTLAKGLNHPWGCSFLPDGRFLVTEREGTLRILDTSNNLSEPISGVPKVMNEGQGGLQDVALDPDFKENGFVYMSYAEAGSNKTASTALVRGKLVKNQIIDFKVIFRQENKVDGGNHFGSRIAFSPDGFLFLTMGDRFKFEPAQDLTNHLGTIVRIKPDGSIPQDNPFLNNPNAKKEIWSYGHRNIESAAFDPQSGKLWIAEMGPQGGDELNQPKAGKNYGWPVVSWGNHYDGKDIPDPHTHPEFEDAMLHWTPVISPSGMIFYTGSLFPDLKGNMLIGGLSAKGIVRVDVTGDNAKEVGRLDLGERIRDVEQAPDGSIYVLTDKTNGEILRLIPKN